MGKRLRKISIWFRRKSHLPIFLLGGAAVLVLFFNEETSMSRNMAYDKEIRELKDKIEMCRDSAEYYRQKREGIQHGTSDLEYVAREQYRMQKPYEDVYLIK